MSHQTVGLEPSTTLRGDKGSELHIVGQKQRDAGAIALYQVFVNCNVGKAPKQALVALPLHEIPLVRLKHADYGGTLEIIPTFAPGLKQVRGMNKMDLEEELIRLRGKVLQAGSPPVGGAYMLQRGDDEINLFTQVYGGMNGQKTTLWESMAALYKGWQTINEEALDAMRRITMEDIERVLHESIAVLRELDGVDEIEIPTAADEVDQGMKGLGLVEVDNDLVTHLTQAGVNDTVAQAFATEVARKAAPASAYEDAESFLSEEAWDRVPGVKGHKGKRSGLIKLREKYEALPNA